MNTGFRKIVRDLMSDYPKNLLLVLAIAIGVFGIGAILGGYNVISREMTDNYLGTTPASATIEIEGDLSEDVVKGIKQLPGIKEAERHATVSARMKVKDKWYSLLLFVVDDFNNKRTNQIYHERGAIEPVEGSMLVERTALTVMQSSIGNSITVKTKQGTSKEIKIVGTVHDPGLAPAWQEQTGYGYISLATLHALGEPRGFDQLRILVDEQPFSIEHITEKAQIVANHLQQAGYDIHEIQVPPPGRHPHQSQMTTVMSLFIIFSFLTLILGSILVATSVATLMVKQIRQIGVMKAIGARSTQLVSMYMMMILLLCLVALVVAIPLSRLAAAGFYNQIAVLLNLEIRDSSIPAGVAAIQIVSGVAIPLLAAAFPVIRGSSISVKRALENFDVSRTDTTRSRVATALVKWSFINDTFRLSVRNVFRQKTRLIMTLSLLAAGGAMFMMALNVSKAWEENLARIYSQRLYDLEIKLDRSIVSDDIVNRVRKIQGVKAVEACSYSSTSIASKNQFNVTRTYPDKGHGSFSIQALPVPVKLLHPDLKEGEWLHDPEAKDVVLNQLARGLYQIGDTIMLSVHEKNISWKIIGFTEDVGSQATAYVSLSEFEREMNMLGKTNILRISFNDRSRERVIQSIINVEDLMEKEHVPVVSTVPVWVLHNAMAAHMKVLVNSLVIMAILMAFVGGIGLMSSMSMNILERTREIGVMRAIGAAPRTIKNLIVWEGLLIGLLSIFIAFVLSLVLSSYMGKLIGSMAFRTPLSLVISMKAFSIWVLIIVIGSYLATLYPSRRANRITTGEALAYE